MLGSVAVFELSPSSLEAATKLVPQSDLNCFAGPLTEKNLRRALMQQEASIDSSTSKWTALVLRQVNSIAHRLLLASPPLVLREVTDHGPNTSTPTYEKGGSLLKRSGGKSAIFWVSVPPLSLRQVTQE